MRKFMDPDFDLKLLASLRTSAADAMRLVTGSLEAIEAGHRLMREADAVMNMWQRDAARERGAE